MPFTLSHSQLVIPPGGVKKTLGKRDNSSGWLSCLLGFDDGTSGALGDHPASGQVIIGFDEFPSGKLIFAA